MEVIIGNSVLNCHRHIPESEQKCQSCMNCNENLYNFLLGVWSNKTNPGYIFEWYNKIDIKKLCRPTLYIVVACTSDANKYIELKYPRYLLTIYHTIKDRPHYAQIYTSLYTRNSQSIAIITTWSHAICVLWSQQLAMNCSSFHIFTMY